MNKLPFYSVKRLIQATGYSLAGFASVFRTEPAFRLEILLSFILAPIALALDCAPIEKIALVGSLFLMLMAELVNTAIETLIDRISPEQHPLSKRAKDIGSAIVFSSIINAAIIWAIILC